MPVAVVGANHRTAPIELREQLAFGRDEVPASLGRLLDEEAADEVAILSTCNRTEVYLTVEEGRPGLERAQAMLAERLGVRPAELAPHLYVHRDRPAVEHLLRVAAGLDSMLIGEPQIQGQVRTAYQAARELATEEGRSPTGPTLNRLFQIALATGSRVRTETGIGIGASSLPGAAVDLAKKIFGTLRGLRALVIGAGEVGEVTLECLRAEGVRTIRMANRRPERVRDLAERWGAEQIPWERRTQALREADLVVCSTAAPTVVLALDEVRAALPDGPGSLLCILDLALPRDVDPRIAEEPNVFLYNLDDLRGVVDTTLGQRRAELPRAEAIVEEGVEEFWAWYSALAVVPTIRDLRSRTERVRQAETERVLRRLGHLSAEDQHAIDSLTRGLVNKLLHDPTVRLREAVGNGRGTQALDTARYLFGLDHDPHANNTADDE